MRMRGLRLYSLSYLPRDKSSALQMSWETSGARCRSTLEKRGQQVGNAVRQYTYSVRVSQPRHLVRSLVVSIHIAECLLSDTCNCHTTGMLTPCIETSMHISLPVHSVYIEINLGKKVTTSNIGSKLWVIFFPLLPKVVYQVSTPRSQFRASSCRISDS